MCNNIIVLYIFIILKIICIFIIPILVIFLRKKKISKILLIIDIVFLTIFLISNIFKVNKCIYNSSMDGIKRTKTENFIIGYTNMHPKFNNTSQNNIIARKDYITYTNKKLYYYNQNSDDMKNVYYEYNSNKIYFNTIGNVFSTLSTAMSTLYESETNPIILFNIYKNNNSDIGSREITLEDVYNNAMEVYSAITIEQIPSFQVESSLKDGNLVIAKLSPKEGSKLTCDSKYILIYSINQEGKYMISDSTLLSNDYICPYSSDAYGSVISKDNMNKSFNLDEIDNEADIYYLVRKG